MTRLDGDEERCEGRLIEAYVEGHEIVVVHCGHHLGSLTRFEEGNPARRDGLWPVVFDHKSDVPASYGCGCSGVLNWYSAELGLWFTSAEVEIVRTS